MARIAGFHPAVPGSIPGMGIFFSALDNLNVFHGVSKPWHSSSFSMQCKLPEMLPSKFQHLQPPGFQVSQSFVAWPEQPQDVARHRGGLGNLGAALDLLQPGQRHFRT